MTPIDTEQKENNSNDKESLLDSVNSPQDIQKLSLDQLNQLSDEIRDYMVTVISKNGGHLASNLGVVELTIAMHYVFDSPRDKIVWDVGHQTYVHKLLTGRKDKFYSLRNKGGISGFPKISESPHDSFGTGHASTSLSAGLGFAKSRDLKKGKNAVVAVIGDGALTGGMAFEAINHLGHLGTDITVILNDNKMSISPNVGALSRYLEQLSVTAHDKRDIKTIFNQLGFSYLGPVDGHDISELLNVISMSRSVKGPCLIHVKTIKGKGYKFAEENACKFHGIGCFNISNGEQNKNKALTYTESFSNALVKIGKEDQRIIGITAAMPDGTGLDRFAKYFPERFYDVGIAEQHAVTFAAAMAAEGFKPVVAIYSTFLQRAFDQIIHDVCVQNLPVIFAVDRAGIVGEDGPTHHGAFDLSYLRLIPNLVVMAPKDENELQHMLKTAVDYDGPVAIRYPRGNGEGVEIDEELVSIPIGESECIVEGKDIVIAAVGSMVPLALEAAESLKKHNINATVFNARYVKPIDKKIIDKITDIGKAVTVEENTIEGGFGSAIRNEISGGTVTISSIALPDEFIEHGSISALRKDNGLTSEKIVDSVLSILDKDKIK